MVDLPGDSATQAPPVGAVDKVRLLFRKGGPLRWLSHHDLLRTFERLLRRADIPFHRSQGFNPHARIVFALSLPLGVVGRSEIVQIELREPMEPEEVCRRLAAHSPAGLEILEARRVPPKAGVTVTGLWYGVEIPPDSREATAEKITALMGAEEGLVQREKPVRRQVNIRPFVKELRLDPVTGWLDIGLHLTPAGTARPEEVLRLLGLGRLTEEGAVLERTRLEIIEGNDNNPAPAPGPDTEAGDAEVG
jgi:radical SAM-linked protein